MKIKKYKCVQNNINERNYNNNKKRYKEKLE